MTGRNRPGAEAGNAIVEFLIVGLALQLGLLGLVTTLASRIDSQSAASLLARQELRSIQLSRDSVAASASIDAILKAVGLTRTEYSLETQGFCPGPIVVTARVRGVQSTESANCAN